MPTEAEWEYAALAGTAGDCDAADPDANQARQPSEACSNGPSMAAASFLGAEQRFRKILGYRDLWMLQAKLKDHAHNDDSSKVA